MRSPLALASIFCLDVSLMASSAQATHRHVTDPNCVAKVKADAHHLPFPKNHFDFVSCFFSVTHADPSDTRSLDEMLRVTRPGGRIQVAPYNAKTLEGWSKHHPNITITEHKNGEVSFVEIKKTH